MATKVRRNFLGRVSPIGALETALRQLADWVEKGIEPSPSSNYEIVDGQVQVPGTATERQGVQPVISLTVNGSTRSVVQVGEPVSVIVEVEAAQGIVVELVEIATAADGTETVADQLHIHPAARVAVNMTRTFDEPGTYFLAVRAAAQTGGDALSPHAQVQNIARARVVVSASGGLLP